MSYKEDIEKLNARMKARRDAGFRIIRITVMMLALSLVILTILLVVDSVSSCEGGQKTKDTTPPTITLTQGDTVYSNLGEPISYFSYATATDDTELKTFEPQSPNVDINKAGMYKVTYVATDTAGNTSYKELMIIISKAEYSMSSLMSKVKTLASAIGITDNMSKEEQVKAIFKYVNSPHKTKGDASILFVDVSNVPNIGRKNWKSDWIEEAHRTIDAGQGDCYSYYSLSKALFTYLDIEHLDIKHSGKADGSTHFWSMVNIGTSDAPKWYYYDATRLLHSFESGSGCLFTESQLYDYNTAVNPGFYDFDHAGYPNTAAVVINKDYKW